MVSTPPTPGPELGAETAESQVAALILGATERASAAILASTERAVKTITDALVAVPVAMSTPAHQSPSAESIVKAFEKIQADSYAIDDLYGGLPLDANIDILVNAQGERVDQYGNVLAPDWTPPGGNEVEIPDPQRGMSDIIAPGTPLVPGIPRLDIHQ